jgi:hypothetical protein
MSDRPTVPPRESSPVAPVDPNAEIEWPEETPLHVVLLYRALRAGQVAYGAGLADVETRLSKKMDLLLGQMHVHRERIDVHDKRINALEHTIEEHYTTLTKLIEKSLFGYEEAHRETRQQFHTEAGRLQIPKLQYDRALKRAERIEKILERLAKHFGEAIDDLLPESKTESEPAT